MRNWKLDSDLLERAWADLPNANFVSPRQRASALGGGDLQDVLILREHVSELLRCRTVPHRRVHVLEDLGRVGFSSFVKEFLDFLS